MKQKDNSLVVRKIIRNIAKNVINRKLRQTVNNKHFLHTESGMVQCDQSELCFLLPDIDINIGEKVKSREEKTTNKNFIRQMLAGGNTKVAGKNPPKVNNSAESSTDS